MTLLEPEDKNSPKRDIVEKGLKDKKSSNLDAKKLNGKEKVDYESDQSFPASDPPGNY